MTTTNPQLAALLTAISNLLKLGGIALAGAGIITKGTETQLEIWAGIVLVVGPLLWDVWNAFASLRLSRAQGVQAGINLTTSGRAVDSDGNPISKFAADATPPKPVTLASADQIVKAFGPAPAEIAKS